MRFPDSLPLPDLAGYRADMQGDHHRQRYLTGSVVRRRVRIRRETLTLSWTLNRTRKEMLEAFHRQAGGALFTLSLPGPDGYTEQQARFSGPLKIMFNGIVYRVSATLKNHPPQRLGRDETDEVLTRLALAVSGYEPDMSQSLYEYLTHELPQVLR